MKKLNIIKRLRDSAVASPNTVEEIMPYEDVIYHAKNVIGKGRPGFLAIVVANGKPVSISALRDNENPDFRETCRWLTTAAITNSGDGLIVAQNTKYRMPSQKVIQNTAILAETLGNLGIQFIDQILVPQAEDGYFSFVENNILN